MGGRWGKELRKVKPFPVQVQGENEELTQGRKSHRNKVPMREDHIYLRFQVLVTPPPPSTHTLNWCVCCKRIRFLPNVGQKQKGRSISGYPSSVSNMKVTNCYTSKRYSQSLFYWIGLRAWRFLWFPQTVKKHHPKEHPDMRQPESTAHKVTKFWWSHQLQLRMKIVGLLMPFYKS